MRLRILGLPPFYFPVEYDPLKPNGIFIAETYFELLPIEFQCKH